MNIKVNIDSALDLQRNKADKIIKLITAKQQWYENNLSQFFYDWFLTVFNLTTADKFGLYVWASILDVSLLKDKLPVPKSLPVIGFDRDDSKNFKKSVFGWNSSSSIDLTVDEERALLKLKAFILSMDGSRIGINKALADIFGAGVISYIDLENMNATYHISDESLKDFILFLNSVDLLPRPAGVKINEIIIGDKPIFGVGENNNNFNRGVFNK